MKMGDDLYNWQSYIQESKAKEERKEEEIERCARSLMQVDAGQCRPARPTREVSGSLTKI
jgi:hypothetical protein